MKIGRVPRPIRKIPGLQLGQAYAKKAGINSAFPTEGPGIARYIEMQCLVHAFGRERFTYISHV